MNIHNYNKSIIELVISAVFLFVFGVIMVQAGKQAQLAHMRETYSICMKAHGESSGASEEACGNAQDATHTEFICSSAASNANCWLEVK